MPRTGLTAEEVKAKAIAAAESNIRTQGLDRTRLVDVARVLGVKHSSLYNHFPDKAALLDAVSEKWTLMVHDALCAVAARKKSPAHLIIDWFVALHRMKRERVLSDPELFKAYNMAAEMKKPFVARHIKDLHAQLFGLVTAAIEQREFAKTAPEKITNYLLEITRGFVHPRLVLEQADQDREPALRATLKIAVDGLRARR